MSCIFMWVEWGVFIFFFGGGGGGVLLDLGYRGYSCSASIPAKPPLTPVYIGCLSSIDSIDTRVLPLSSKVQQMPSCTQTPHCHTARQRYTTRQRHTARQRYTACPRLNSSPTATQPTH